MKWDYTLKPLAYAVHNRGVWLGELVEAPLAKHVDKDRTHGTGLINLYPGSCGQLMEPQAVQRDIHTMVTRKMIRWTNFVYTCLFYRLCQHQDQNHQKQTLICPHMHHKFQPWIKGQVNHKWVRTCWKSQPQCQPMLLRVHSRVPSASTLPRLRSWWWMDMTHNKHYCIGNL